ncbi:MAG: DUF2306 domain-containing protein [Hyphomicrobiaceae bacterium]|nr:DUF2306 domain-containing protein [Hyphomicrobiaceae bacterium]
MAFSQTRDTARAKLEIGKLARTVLLGGFAIVVMGYGVMAFQYFFAFFAGEREWWNLFQAQMVSDEFSFGDGSVFKEQHEFYSFNKFLLFGHTTLGGICLAIGWSQFVSRFRKSAPQIHRTVGKVYLATALLSMTLGLLHLSTVPLRGVFSGPAFGIGLWGLDFLVITTAVLAYTAIRNKDVRAHQGWMAFNYALICATPLLRVFWLTFGSTTDLTQSQINSGISTVLLPLCLIVGMVWYSTEYMRDRRSHSS